MKNVADFCNEVSVIYSASSRVKRKSFYGKSELQIFLLISGGHIGAPKRYTNIGVTKTKTLEN